MSSARDMVDLHLRPSACFDKMARQLEVAGTLEIERSVRPKTGTRILREWRGRTYVVEVADGGFLHDGSKFASLSHVARAITGTRLVGPALLWTEARCACERGGGALMYRSSEGDGAAHSETKTVRAAIYTRVSTDESLGMEFNSLDAQLEACAAYITSQRHEGWAPVSARYDDGGYSGGSMKRPALERLLADVKAGLVDVIVVYKIDRLTRSLADFSRIVDVLDAYRASFISITQAFSTTTSMGRLTLNVLLSFAQFEREVGAERVRDKIDSSKKKGIWMGGVVPLGYDVSNRKLVVNEPEADTVRLIFERYIALRSVTLLEPDLAQRGVISKCTIGKSGVARGGEPFTRGALYNCSAT